MRTAFVKRILELAEDNSKINVVAGDLGFGVLDPFKEKFPHRFLNGGVAEQSMTGIAAGMALEGETVFTYSIANFPTFRCLEQIRNDVCYHKADVKIVAVGAGVAYGTHGYTHFGVEDIAIMRCLPHMQVVCPADPIEAQAIADVVCANHGPAYIRLGKNNEPKLHTKELSKEVGVSYPLVWNEGERYDGVILATGSIAYQAVEAQKILKAKGMNVGVVSVPWIKPFDLRLLDSIVQRGCKRIYTLEEHGPFGGLYSCVLEELSRKDIQISVKQFSLPSYIDKISPQEHLLESYGLTAIPLAESILKDL